MAASMLSFKMAASMLSSKMATGNVIILDGVAYWSLLRVENGFFDYKGDKNSFFQKSFQIGLKIVFYTFQRL